MRQSVTSPAPGVRCAAAGSGVGQGPGVKGVPMRPSPCPLAPGAGHGPPSPRAAPPVVAQWGMPMTMLCFWRLGGGPQRAGPRPGGPQIGVDDIVHPIGPDRSV
jgi:hypothetical protein